MNRNMPWSDEWPLTGYRRGAIAERDAEERRCRIEENMSYADEDALFALVSSLIHQLKAYGVELDLPDTAALH